MRFLEWLSIALLMVLVFFLTRESNSTCNEQLHEIIKMSEKGHVSAVSREGDCKIEWDLYERKLD